MNNAITLDLKLTALQVYSMVMRHEPSPTVSNAGNYIMSGKSQHL